MWAPHRCLAMLLSVSVLGGCTDEMPATEARAASGGADGLGGGAGSAGNAASGGNAGAAGQAALRGCPMITPRLLAEDDAPLGLLAVGDDVYWAASAPVASGFEHRLRKVPREGGEPETLYATGAEIGALGVSGDELVFAEVDILAGTADVLALPRSGGKVRQVADLGARFDRVDRFGFAVADGFAYGLGVTSGTSFEHHAFRVDLASGEITVLATFSLSFASDVRGLVVSDDTVSLAYLGSDLYRFPREASSTIEDVAPVWTSQYGVEGLAPDGQRTLVLSNGFVRRIDEAGKQTPLVEDTGAYRGLAFDGQRIAWGERDQEGSERVRLRAEDGSLCTVADFGVISVLDVRLSDERVLWANTASRTAGGGVWSAALRYAP